MSHLDSGIGYQVALLKSPDLECNVLERARSSLSHWIDPEDNVEREQTGSRETGPESCFSVYLMADLAPSVTYHQSVSGT